MNLEVGRDFKGRILDNLVFHFGGIPILGHV